MQADAAKVTQRTGSEHAVRERCVNMIGALQCLVLESVGMSVDITCPVGPLNLTGEGKKIFVA